MNIRPLTPNDLQALLELYRHLHESDSALPDANEIDSVWSEIMSNHRLKYFGGFVDDSLVSSCTISVIPNLTRGCRPYGVIENVVTHSAYRRRGYGSAILQGALSHAWSVGCYKVMLLTGRKDEATLRFYQSAGFDPNGKQAFIAKPAV
jgi:GNAT superfamily N-acetyltransferase